MPLSEGFDTLTAALDIAVLVAIEEVREWTEEARHAFCREHAQVISEQSDDLMFGGKKGRTAELLAVLARSLACLAFQPGGVKFAGRHWVAS